MKDKNESTERRQHERGSVQNLVVGILNSDEPAIIGSIKNISLGGVMYIYALRMSSNDKPINSIDLIAENICLTDIPCEYAWQAETEAEPDCNIKDLRLCGIKFGKLNPYQIFLLGGFIKHFTSLGSNGFILDAEGLHI